MLETQAIDAPVLIVDDDGDLRSLLALALRRAGLSTIDAGSGEEALAVISRRTLSGVVCDLNMGGVSGLDVVRQIRRRPETSTLPFLLMTGSGEADSVIDGLDAGADDFLAKPVRLEELVARVKAHMRTRHTWTSMFESEMEARVHAVRAIGRLRLSPNPEELAAEVVAELAERTGAYHVGVFRLSVSERLLPLARYVARSGVVRGGSPLPPGRAREMLERARQGPWSEQTGEALPAESGDIFWTAPPD
ncbi:MAG: response regulator transcription factor, partial [Ilumatobacteraceae bacterium]